MLEGFTHVDLSAQADKLVEKEIFKNLTINVPISTCKSPQKTPNNYPNVRRAPRGLLNRMTDVKNLPC